MPSSTGARPLRQPRPPEPTRTTPAQRLLLGHAWPWVLLWLLSRGWMLHRWARDYRYIGNDVRYYFDQLDQGAGYGQVLREYPLPMVWVLDLLRLPIDGDVNLYLVLFAITMAALDGCFSIWLWRQHSRVAAIYWMTFVFLLGPLVWFRYDLLAGVVVGAAAFLVARRPMASGGLVALGAGIKLWPALLVAALVGHSRPGRRRLAGFTAGGMLLALAALVDGGLARLLSPLTWQSQRGLQIESVWASVPMWLRAFGPDADSSTSRWSVQMSPFNAFEVFGPGVDLWLKLSSLAMVLGIGFAAAVALLAWRRSHTPAHVRAMAMTSVVLVMVVANKTLSPQYLAWVGAVLAAWFGLAPAGAERVRAGSAAVAGLALAAATQYIYPMHYIGLIGGLPAGRAVTAVLVARNLLLVAMALLCCGWTLQALGTRKDPGTTNTPDDKFAPATGDADNIAQGR